MASCLIATRSIDQPPRYERMVRERMLALGADPAGDTPEEFARFIHDDQAKWSRLMKQAGITLE